MRRAITLAVLSFIIFASFSAVADNRDADHEALRGIMKTSSEALNAGDFDKLKPVLSTKDFTFITIDNQKFKNIDDFSKYWRSLLEGPTALLKGIKIEPEADGKTAFLSDNVGVVDGTSKETYTFRDGDVRQMTTRWSAVVDKEDGNWKIAQIHFSANVLDNPVLSAAKSTAGGNILLPGLVGFVIGSLLIGLLGRKKTA
jgi:ketosteroid isomerase-like protein